MDEKNLIGIGSYSTSINKNVADTKNVWVEANEKRNDTLFVPGNRKIDIVM